MKVVFTDDALRDFDEILPIHFDELSAYTPHLKRGCEPS